MRSFYLTGSLCMLSLAWAANSAHAQYGTSLLPLPNAAPGFTGGAVPASYSSSYQTPQPTAPTAPTGTTDFETALHDNNSASSCDACGDCGTCNPCCATGGWFGSVGGLVMGRNRAPAFWTTFDTTNNANQLLNTQNAGANWAGGGQVTIGYAACGCCGPGPAIAFTYWGLGPMTGNTSIVSATNELGTPIDLRTQTGQVTYGGVNASHFFDGAHEHRISRTDRVNNFELNGLFPVGTYNNRIQVAGLAGFRYLRFDENLIFGSVSGGNNFGDLGGSEEAYMNSNAINNLYGGQIGAFINYMVTDRLGVFIMPKTGLFLNQMNCRFQSYTGAGVTGIADGVPLDITAHKSDISFLGEIDTGLSWAFTQNLRGFIGYRVVGISNIALADNQFQHYLADTGVNGAGGFSSVNQNGGLILHGAFAGVAWGF